jgi:hypothetical protein
MEVAEHAELPSHIAIGLQDQATQVVDEFMIDAQLRLAHEGNLIPVDAPLDERVEVIKTAAMPVIPATEQRTLSEEEKDLRRAEIYAWQQRRRKFSRPILRFDTIHFPTRRD